MRHAVEIMHEGSITVGRGYGAGALVRPAGDGDRRLLWCLLPPLWRALTNGGTVRLPRLAGMAHAMDLTLTGRKIEAAEALQMGLCNRVVPTGQRPCRRRWPWPSNWPGLRRPPCWPTG